MVIEHSFVTTLDAPHAMQRAMAFLRTHGFENAGPTAFPVASGVGAHQWETLEMRRGKKNAERAKSVAELPQVVHLNFDRGRVTVALSITPSSQLGGSGISPVLMFGLIGVLMMRNAGSSDNPKKMKLHQALLISIANGLERVLAEGQTDELAVQEWDGVERDIAEDKRKRSRRMWIVLAVVVAIMLGLATVAFMASARR